MSERRPRVHCDAHTGGIEVTTMTGESLVNMPNVDIHVNFDLGDDEAALAALEQVLADVIRQIREARTT